MQVIDGDFNQLDVNELMQELQDLEMGEYLGEDNSKRIKEINDLLSNAGE